MSCCPDTPAGALCTLSSLTGLRELRLGDVDGNNPEDVDTVCNMVSQLTSLHMGYCPRLQVRHRVTLGLHTVSGSPVGVHICVVLMWLGHDSWVFCGCRNKGSALSESEASPNSTMVPPSWATC